MSLKQFLVQTDTKLVPLRQERSHCIKNWLRFIFKKWFLKYGIPCSRIAWKISKKLPPKTQERSHCVLDSFSESGFLNTEFCCSRIVCKIDKKLESLTQKSVIV